jgi:hypothetical protein
MARIDRHAADGCEGAVRGGDRRIFRLAVLDAVDEFLERIDGDFTRSLFLQNIGRAAVMAPKLAALSKHSTRFVNRCCFQNP